MSTYIIYRSFISLNPFYFVEMYACNYNPSFISFVFNQLLF
jgi:hypothetical protein